MIILAIDPGTTESGYVIYDTEQKCVQEFGKVDNDKMLNIAGQAKDIFHVEHCACEMIASYGMAVGQEVFQTCVWIGRFTERFGSGIGYVYRKDVKMFLCGQTIAKDTNIRQAIIDTFGGSKQKAIGLKKTPGPLYGMKADIWAALAVALTAEYQIKNNLFLGLTS